MHKGLDSQVLNSVVAGVAAAEVHMGLSFAHACCCGPSCKVQAVSVCRMLAAMLSHYRSAAAVARVRWRGYCAVGCKPLHFLFHAGVSVRLVHVLLCN